MKRYLWLLGLILILAIALVGCQPKTPQESGGSNSYDVTQATDNVYRAMKNACAIEGVDELYFAFDVTHRQKDDYATLVNFAAMVDISPANVADDRNSRLAFTVSQDVVGTKSLEAYYADGTLYLNYPPLINRAAIDEVSLGAIAKVLYGSYTTGAIHSVAELLPSIGNRVFADCTLTSDGNFNTYTFAFDYEAAFAMLGDICQAVDLDITRTELAGLLGWSVESIRQKSALNTSISFTTEKKGGEEIFHKAALHTNDQEGELSSVEMTRWVSTVVTDLNRASCEVPLADGRTSFGTFHPANLDLTGTLTLDVIGSESMTQRVGGLDLVSRTTKQRYVYDYTLKSNYQNGALTALLTLTVEGRDFHAYIEGADVYLDLTAFGFGAWKLPASSLSGKLQALGFDAIDPDLSPADWFELIVDLASDRKRSADRIDLELDGHGFDLLWRKVAGTTGVLASPLLQVDGVDISLSTANNKFNSLSADFSVWGSHATLFASNPKVGAPVEVSRPAWAAEARAAFDTPATFVLEGTIKSSTNLSGNTKLVEALVESLSGGDKIDLGSREITRYVASARWTAGGAMTALKVDFADLTGAPIGSIYYTTEDAGNFYVLYPAVGGVTHASTHSLAIANRFTLLLNAINGNAPVSELDDCTLVNTAHGLSLTWSQAGVDRLLSHLGKILPELPASLDDDLGLESLRLNLSTDPNVRLSFGQGYIDCTIARSNVADFDLTLDGTGLGSRDITLLDEYDLPTSVTLSMPSLDGAQAVRFAVDGWTFDNLSAITSGGKVAVTAVTKVLGQSVRMVLNTDCDMPSGDNMAVYGDSLFETTYAQYLDGKTFTFARYNAPVDPYTVLQHFDKASIRVGDKTYSDRKVVWYCGNTPLSSVEFDAPQDRVTVSPYISTFFGTDLKLGEGYVIALDGAKVAGVEQSDLYMTIAAYRIESDPFDEATYSSKLPLFRLEDGNTATVNTVLWKIDSVRNNNLRQNGSAVRNADAVRLLDEALYSLSGTYTIDVAVVDSLGVESYFAVNVAVEPRVFDLNNMTFGGILDGVTYQNGLFAVQPLVLDKVGVTTSLAHSVSATFGQETVHLTAISWNLPASDINVLVGKDGTFGITFGNEVGGLQQVEGLRYSVAPLDATSLSLVGKRGTVLGTLPTYVDLDRQDEYEFSLEHLSAYSYDYPAAVRLTTATGYAQKEVTFAPQGWDDKALWYDTRTFTDTASFFGLTVTVNMQFDQKVVASWQFEPLQGDVVLEAPLYLASDEGAYVVEGNRYVPYDAQNPDHQGLRRFNLSEEIYEVAYRKVSAADQDIKRLILDPNKVNFHCLECYPDQVRVTFLDGTSTVVKVVWPIEQLDEVTVEQGFRNTLSLTLPDGQALPEAVGLWIASARPTAVYTSVEYTYTESLEGQYVWYNNDYIPYDETLHQGRQRYDRTIVTQVVNGDARVVGTTTLSISLFDYLEGAFVRNDPTDLKTIHDLLCDRDDFEAGCLGDLYFEYAGGSDVDSGWFAITSWQDLSVVLQYFREQVEGGKGVQEVAGSVNLIAKVHDVECVIPLVIAASTMTEIRLTAVPYANSSLSHSGQSLESMKVDGTSITVDPYVADPLSANSYPQRMIFTLKGQDSVNVAIDGWDLKGIEGLVPYRGGTYTVYALLHTAIGIDVRVPVTVNVLARTIESVYGLDGAPLRGVLTVDVYSTTPYGQNVQVIEGRTYALRNVLVKFAGDDLKYRMLLRYDVTDYVASFDGGVLGQNVSVAVGNDAGGYQTLSGYNVYAEGSVILSITTDDETIKAYLPDGVLYDANRATPFASFAPADDGQEALRAAAWEQLTLRLNKLTMTVGASGGTSRTIVASRDLAEGLAFGWTRGEDDVMYLTLVNRNSLFGAHLATLQAVSTGADRKIALDHDMFNLGKLAVDFGRTYVKGYDVTAFLAEYPVKPQSTVVFEQDEILTVLSRGGETLAAEDELIAGDYTLTITVSNPQYGGAVTIDFEVAKAVVQAADITVTEGNRVLNVWGGLERLWSGYPLDLVATTASGVDVELTYYDGETLLDEEPTAVGSYTVKLVSLDANYQTDASFELTILPLDE